MGGNGAHGHEGGGASPFGVRIKIDMAAKERDKKLLTELFVMEEELSAELEEKRRLHASAVEEAIRIRDNYKRFESEMNSRLRELAAIKSQSEIVAMREKISDLDYLTGAGRRTISIRSGDR